MLRFKFIFSLIVKSNSKIRNQEYIDYKTCIWIITYRNLLYHSYLSLHEAATTEGKGNYLEILLACIIEAERINSEVLKRRKLTSYIILSKGG